MKTLISPKYLFIILASICLFTTSYEAQAQFGNITKKVKKSIQKKKKPQETKTVSNTTKTENEQSKTTNPNSTKNTDITLPKGHPATKPFFNLKNELKRCELAIQKGRKPNQTDVEDARTDVQECQKLAPEEDWSSYETRVAAIEGGFKKAVTDAKAREVSQAAEKDAEKALEVAIQAVYSKDNLNLKRYEAEVDGVTYGKMAAKVDWAKLTELEGDSPHVYGVGTQSEFEAGYPEYVEKILIRSINEQLDRANTSNTGAAYDAAHHALGYTSGGLIFLPLNNQLQQLNNQARSKVTHLTKELSKTWSGPFHADHVGDMLASNSKVTIGSESESNYKSDFTGEETIYLVSYWRQTIAKETSGGKRKPEGYDGMKEILLTVNVDDGTEEFSVKIPTTKEDSGSSSVVQVCLTPSIAELTADRLDYADIEAYIRLFSYLKNLSPRAHILKLQYGEERGGNSAGRAPLFQTTITITGNQEHFTKLYDKAKAILIDATRMPPKGASNPAAEAKGKTFISAKGTYLRILTAKDWYIEKSAVGVPLRKYNRMYAAYKSGDGKCYYMPMRAAREYTGGGNYGPIEVSANESIPINCTNVNK